MKFNFTTVNEFQKLAENSTNKHKLFDCCSKKKCCKKYKKKGKFCDGCPKK